MNEDIVLFLDSEGVPAALRDRCCHRTAKLSRGWIDEGRIVCGYHGWTYDRDGRVMRIRQYDPTANLPRYRVDAFHWFVATTVVDILNPPAAYRVTGTTDPTTTRTMRNHWYLPFCRRMDMTYPSGIRHIIVNCATPIDDGRIQLMQLRYRNDTENQCPTQALIDWGAGVVYEDRDILEATDPDAALDLAHGTEAHMTSDRPGLIMRRRLQELSKSNNDPEVTRNYVVAGV